MWKLVFNVTDVFFLFGSPKRKTHKIHKIMPNLQLFKAYVFVTKVLKNKQNLQLIWSYENMVKF
jgi:hypothetical protein